MLVNKAFGSGSTLALRAQLTFYPKMWIAAGDPAELSKVLENEYGAQCRSSTRVEIPDTGMMIVVRDNIDTLKGFRGTVFVLKGESEPSEGLLEVIEYARTSPVLYLTELKRLSDVE